MDYSFRRQGELETRSEKGIGKTNWDLEKKKKIFMPH